MSDDIEGQEPPVEGVIEKPEPAIIERGEYTPGQVAEVNAGEFYTVSQVAEMLKYSESYIYQMVQKGIIRGVKPLGGGWRIPKSEYERVAQSGVGVEMVKRKKVVVEEQRTKVEEINVDPEVAKHLLPEKPQETKGKEPEKKNDGSFFGIKFDLFK